MADEILTVEEVAALLKVTPNFIHEKCRSRAKNPLPVHRIGRYLRFTRSEVIEWYNLTRHGVLSKGRRRNH